MASTLSIAKAETVQGGQPWEPGTPAPRKGGLQYLTQQEFDTVGAIAERFISADELSISGKEAGCTTFIDRQLVGDYGNAAAIYLCERHAGTGAAIAADPRAAPLSGTSRARHVHAKNFQPLTRKKLSTTSPATIP